jgi:hypothetical protein
MRIEMSAKPAIRGHFMNLVCDTLDRPLRLVNLTGPSTAKGVVRRSKLYGRFVPEAVIEVARKKLVLAILFATKAVIAVFDLIYRVVRKRTVIYHRANGQDKSLVFGQPLLS